MSVGIIESGWPGHFVDAVNCHFRRNTLLWNDKIKIVVRDIK